MSIMNKNVNTYWLAWLGGVIDGEGCIGIYESSKGHYTAKLSIGNTDVRLVAKVRDIMGHGAIYHYDRNPPNKPIHTINVGKRSELRDVLEAVYPWLVIKSLQAFFALEFLKTVRRPGHSPGDELSDADKEIREYCYKSVKELNKRGV